MRAQGYVLVGEKLYAPGEDLPDGLDNVEAAETDDDEKSEGDKPSSRRSAK